MSLTITVDEYLAELIQTKQKRVLVEGKTDRIALDKLLTEYSEINNGQLLRYPLIDTAERIQDVGLFYNKQKILEVFSRIQGKPYETKCIGLIDREFIGFETASEIRDDIGCHKNEGNLVWTRGHSLENYFFDVQIIKKSIHILSSANHTRALQLFEEHLEQLLEIACAVSLGTLQIGNSYQIEGIFDRIENSLSENIISFQESGVSLDLTTWLPVASQRLNNPMAANDLLDSYVNWLSRIQSSPKETIRWLCHGHIGMTFISYFYNQCLIRLSPNSSKNQKDLLNTNNDLKFAALAHSWANLALTIGVEHPKELLDKFSE